MSQRGEISTQAGLGNRYIKLIVSGMKQRAAQAGAPDSAL